jgi:hypothetical protein
MDMAFKKRYLLIRMLKHVNVGKPDLLTKGLEDRPEHETKRD